MEVTAKGTLRYFGRKDFKGAGPIGESTYFRVIRELQKNAQALILPTGGSGHEALYNRLHLFS